MGRPFGAADQASAAGVREGAWPPRLLSRIGPLSTAGAAICTVRRRGRAHRLGMPQPIMPKSQLPTAKPPNPDGASPDGRRSDPPVPMTTAEATVGSLVGHGIDAIYGLPGVQNDHLFRCAVQVLEPHPHTSIPATSRLPPIWRSAPRSPPASRRFLRWCRAPACSNSAAALLTAYSMNAPVLALVGQIPEGDIGRDLGHLPELRDQAGIIARLVDHSVHIRSPQTASRLVAQAMRAMRSGRRGPAALECAIDVWGKAGAVALQRRWRPREPAIDEDAILAAARRLGATRNPMIICGAGAQDAAREVTELFGHAAGSRAGLPARPRHARQPRSPQRDAAARP